MSRGEELLVRDPLEAGQTTWSVLSVVEKQSRFSGFLLPPELTTVRNNLPMLPDFVVELTSMWNKPLSTRVHDYGQFLDLDGAEKAGLVNPPSMEASLAAYLAPAQNHGFAGTTTLPSKLQSKRCRFSASQLEKIY